MKIIADRKADWKRFKDLQPGDTFYDTEGELNLVVLNGTCPLDFRAVNLVTNIFYNPGELARVLPVTAKVHVEHEPPCLSLGSSS